MLRFDRVVPTLIECAIQHLPLHSIGLRAILVQTATGQVRLVLVGEAKKESIQTVEGALQTALGPWFQPPVIGTECGPKHLRPIARQLWQDQTSSRATTSWERRWPRSWTEACLSHGIAEAQLRDIWECKRISRSKEHWLWTIPTTPPWKMRGDNPPITAFYGFKGGVGRSTSLAILAWHLARGGKRVLCLDLDLESPGLSQALSHRPAQVDLLNWLLQAALDPRSVSALDRPWEEVKLHGERLWLAGPGELDHFYTDKLGRLDFLHHEEKASPVQEALTQLLLLARKELNLHHILLDCRSGLHDLAGLALHDLSHVAVLVGRGDRQEMAGLPLFWRSLWGRSGSEGHLLVLRTGHSLPLDSRVFNRQKEDLHQLMVDCWEDEHQPPPALEDQGPHEPCPIGDIPEIRSADGLSQVSLATLHQGSFLVLLRRLEGLWSPT